MSYLVLARKWRPGTFDDLVGQENISLTLRNAIATGKLAQALIFSGPRGVGKTSTARIVAKALNCQKENIADRPCREDECLFCSEISEGKSFDVQEIDAASHTGVNDIREIIGNVKYLPTTGKTKVYIIDEVHMLSQAAFNALLKTLEEPPPHVLFILATTEIHKIPATILSRCQRYDFRKIPVLRIKETLDKIKDSENIEIDEKTLYLIAKEADGSLRDALSLMDQLIATFGNKIDHDEAVTVMGLLESSYVKEVVSRLINRNAAGCIETVQKAFEKGINPKKFAEEITKLLRAALFIKICGKDAIKDLSEDEKKELSSLTGDEDIQSLEVLFKLMLEGSESVQRSYYPEMALESALVSLCLVNRSIPIEEILQKINKLTPGTDTPGSGPGPGKAPTQPARSSAPEKKQPEKSENKKILRDNTKNYSDGSGLESPDFSRQDFIERVRNTNTMLAMHLEKASGIEKTDSGILIEFPSSSINFNYLNRPGAIKTLKEFTGKIYNLDVTVKLDENAVQQSSADEEKKSRNSDIKSDPVVKEALKIFEGRIISTKYRKKE